MSDDQDSASVPVVITQVKLGDCSWQGGDNGLLHACQDQELQTFLHLLGEFTWERADCGPNVQTDVINGICPIQLGQRGPGPSPSQLTQVWQLGGSRVDLEMAWPLVL
jgi:hypothetical protein